MATASSPTFAVSRHRLTVSAYEHMADPQAVPANARGLWGGLQRGRVGVYLAKRAKGGWWCR